MKKQFLSNLNKSQLREMATTLSTNAKSNFAKASREKCMRVILNADMPYKKLVTLAYTT